jgi:putative pyruvate formate lyase activating enzyme
VNRETETLQPQGNAMEPAYLSLDRRSLQQRIDALLHRLGSCDICPRQCGVNRLEGETGFCRIGRKARIASYNLHFGEEAPLVGTNGSGTVFFAGCNLGCVFCQNYDISHGTDGSVPAEPDELAGLMLQLQRKGAHNINFVTPSHVTPQILESLPAAIDQGLTLPLVYNCSGYESRDTLRQLAGIFDIYMPDVKFAARDPAEKYCQAGDYPEVAKQAVLEMHRQVGDLELDENGVARRGLLVRHLIMPDDMAGTQEWLRFLAEEVSASTYLNLMDQYRPCGEASAFPELCARISHEDLERARSQARQLGLSRLDERERLDFRALLKFLGS